MHFTAQSSYEWKTAWYCSLTGHWMFYGRMPCNSFDVQKYWGHAEPVAMFISIMDAKYRKTLLSKELLTCRACYMFGIKNFDEEVASETNMGKNI